MDKSPDVCGDEGVVLLIAALAAVFQAGTF